MGQTHLNSATNIQKARILCFTEKSHARIKSRDAGMRFFRFALDINDVKEKSSKISPLPWTGLVTWKSKWYNSSMSTSTVQLLGELKELKELLARAAQRSGKSPGQLMRETMTLQWKGYDPDSRVFLFETGRGVMFYVPLNEMERITEFLRNESEKTKDSDPGGRV
jgi:hypothetical protein